jgi:hypothetical protein
MIHVINVFGIGYSLYYHLHIIWTGKIQPRLSSFLKVKYLGLDNGLALQVLQTAAEFPHQSGQPLLPLLALETLS